MADVAKDFFYPIGESFLERLYVDVVGIGGPSCDGRIETGGPSYRVGGLAVAGGQNVTLCTMLSLGLVRVGGFR
jgi:hypothetical protein